MPISVQLPGYARDSSSPIERLLGLVNAGFQVRDNLRKGTTLDQEEKTRQLQQQNLEQEMAQRKTAADNATQGIMTPLQWAENANKFKLAKPEDAGAITLKVPSGQGGALQEMRVVPKDASGLDDLVKVMTLNMHGLAMQKTKQEMADAAFKKTPQGKLESSPAEAKAKIGLLADALNNMTEYEKAFASGERPPYLTPSTPLVGGLVSDTPLTKAQRMIDEAVGRLNSGGAINKEELAGFRAMDPRPGDSDEIKKAKLASQRRMLETKLAGFGFTPQDLSQAGPAFDLSKMGYDASAAGTRQKAQASTKGGAAATMLPEASAGAPTLKPGAIEDGHVYLGGPPGDPHSWQKVRGK